MDERVAEEFVLLQEAFPGASYKDKWILLPEYCLPTGWSAGSVDLAFNLRDPYPATSPYGIYAPDGLTFEGKKPGNYKPAKKLIPPFPGQWAMFSWQAENWFPGVTAASGHNLATFAVGMKRRFLEGI